MQKLSYAISLLLIFLLISCNGNKKEKEAENNKEKEIETLKSEVIGIHDEVMPKMDDIMKLKARLQENMEVVNDSLSTDSLVIERQLLIDLENADAAMMVWMRNYDPMMEELSNVEKLQYLEAAKRDIQSVKDQMLSAISKSEEFLEETE